MGDKYDAKARDIAEWLNGAVGIMPNAAFKELRTSISSALRSAAAEEREEILKEIAAAPVKPGELVDQPSYTQGDVFEAYFAGVNDFKAVVRSSIRSRGIPND